MPATEANAQAGNVSDDGLSDSDIAMLSDVGQMTPDLKDPAKKALLERLIAQGFVKQSGDAHAPTKYELTARAQQVLTARGAGLNEL